MRGQTLYPYISEIFLERWKLSMYNSTYMETLLEEIRRQLVKRTFPTLGKNIDGGIQIDENTLKALELGRQKGVTKYDLIVKGLPRATANRIISKLEENGYIIKAEEKPSSKNPQIRKKIYRTTILGRIALLLLKGEPEQLLNMLKHQAYRGYILGEERSKLFNDFLELAKDYEEIKYILVALVLSYFIGYPLEICKEFKDKRTCLKTLEFIIGVDFSFELHEFLLSVLFSAFMNNYEGKNASDPVYQLRVILFGYKLLNLHENESVLKCYNLLSDFFNKHKKDYRLCARVLNLIHRYFNIRKYEAEEYIKTIRLLEERVRTVLEHQNEKNENGSEP